MLNLAVHVNCKTKLHGPDVVGHVHIQEGIDVPLVIIIQPSMNLVCRLCVELWTYVSK